MAKFCADGRAPPMVEIKGEESEAVRPCACESRKNLVLITDFVSSESPVKCLDCYGVVPLYRLPNFAHIEGLLFWQGDYKACDTLQIGCTTGERFALREMDRADSTLSRNGRDLCKTIEESSGIPTYYYLHKYYGRSHAQEWKRRCPSCVGPWLMPKRIEPIFDFRCDRCRLLSNIAFSLGAG